jgi:hypothetical protein
VTSLPQAERELRDLLLKVQKSFDWQKDLFLGMRELRKLPDGHEMREQFVTNYEWAQQWLEQALKGDTQAAGLFDKAVDTLIDDLGQPQQQQPQPPLQLLQPVLQLPDWALLPLAERALRAVLVKTGASVDQLQALFLGTRELRQLPDGHISREQFVTSYGWAQHWLQRAQQGDANAAACFSMAVDTLIEELP